MRESTGGAYLLIIALFFISAVMIMFVSALSYNKSFKVKNRIIEIIESHESYSKDSAAEKEIIEYLKDINYNTNPKKQTDYCPPINGKDAIMKNSSDTFEYCVYRFSSGANKSYYKVVTYSYFKFPIIDSLFKYTIYGETRLM